MLWFYYILWTWNCSQFNFNSLSSLSPPKQWLTLISVEFWTKTLSSTFASDLWTLWNATTLNVLHLTKIRRLNLESSSFDPIPIIRNSFHVPETKKLQAPHQMRGRRSPEVKFHSFDFRAQRWSLRRQNKDRIFRKKKQSKDRYSDFPMTLFV